MAIKLLISGESNSGKTTLTKDLVDTLVVSHDGKKYPFPIPHILVTAFDSTSELLNSINEKIVAYKDKFGSYPKTIVFDSVSKIFETILNSCNKKHTGFNIYTNLDKEINEFTSYIENTLIASDINVVIISHAIWDQDTAKYALVGKGSFAKRGSFLAETDQAIFVETKSNKRIIHFRSTKFPSRTLAEDDPDNVAVEDFSLQTYIDKLVATQTAVDEYAL